MEGGRSDVLWDVMQEDTRPGYGFMLQPTAAHPEGMTTMPERWTLGDSQNHVILLQIEEWFHTGVAGIKQAPNSIAYRDLIIKPTPVGDLTHAKGHYTTPQGTARSEWRRDATGITRFDVTVPANTTATVYVPATSAAQTFVATGSGDARYLRYENGYQVYDVAPGDVTFLQGTSSRRHGRRHGAGDAVAHARHAGRVRRVHARAWTAGLRRHARRANVISTAGDATLSVSDPTPRPPAAWSTARSRCREPLQAQARAPRRVRAAVRRGRGSATRAAGVLDRPGEQRRGVDRLPAAHRRHPGAAHGRYSKTLTFTLSTTTP